MTTFVVPRTAREEFRADWPLLLTAMMGAGLSAILAYALGIFIGPIGREFGWNPEIIVTGFTLSTVLGVVGVIFSGRLIERFGARNLTLTGTFILAGATVALGLIPNSVPAYLGCYVAVAAAHTLLSPIIWQKIVVERFVKARGLAVSIVLCGPNIAGAVAPILATLSIARADWHIAYFVLAAYMILSSLPLTWLFFRETPRRSRSAEIGTTVARPPEATGGLSLSLAFGTREFWLLSASFMFAGVGMTGYTVFFVPMLLSKDLALLLAASMVSAFSIAAICGRLLAGFAMDHMFAPRVAALALALPVISSVLLLYLPPLYLTVLAAAVLTGLSSGAEYNMITYLATRYFGLRDFGSIGGLLFAVFMIGTIGGQQLPPLLLRSGSYDDVLLFFGGCFLFAATLMLFCRPYPHFCSDKESSMP